MARAAPKSGASAPERKASAQSSSAVPCGRKAAAATQESAATGVSERRRLSRSWYFASGPTGLGRREPFSTTVRRRKGRFCQSPRIQRCRRVNQESALAGIPSVSSTSERSPTRR